MIPRFYFTGIKPTLRLYKHFGIVLPTKLLWYIFLKVLFHTPQKARYYNEKKHITIEKWLLKQFYNVLSEEPSQANPYRKKEEAPIWIFWWDGFSKAPELVKACVSNLLKNCGEHPVHFLDKTNYKKYIDLPDFLESRIFENKLSLAHFADILRVNLLYEHGGLWIDSTVFCANKIDESIFDKEFFSIRIESLDNFSVSDYKWATFLMHALPKSPLMFWIKRFFEEYLNRQDYFIDYLLLDYLIDIVQKHDKPTADLFQSIPYTNPELYTLINNLDKPYSQSTWEQMTARTSFFKLSHRMHLLEGSSNTFYGFLISGKS